jgi:hypothetical protein
LCGTQACRNNACRAQGAAHHIHRAAVCAESDQSAEAEQAARAVLKRDPDFTISRYSGPVHFKNPKRLEDLKATLRKAGLPE